jgi:hypothetical protein
VTAHRAVTTEAPQWRLRRRGRITRTVALYWPTNASPSCDNLLAKFGPERSRNDRE